MIICTRACDGLVKNSLPKEKRNSLSIRRFVEVCNLIQLDPETEEQGVEAFIVAATDVQSPRLAAAFEAALAQKHPNARVIFINKSKKPVKYNDNYPGIDVSLMSPKAQEVSDAIFKMAAELSEKPKVQSSADIAAQLKPRDASLSFNDIAEATKASGLSEIDLMLEEDEKEAAVVESAATQQSQDDSVLQSALPTPDIQEEEQVADGTPSLVKRMKNAKQVADVSLMFREVTAETMLRNLAKENAQYGVLENKINQLKEDIQAIMLDTALMDNQKLQKIRSIAYDKRYYNLQSNTIIEQYVTEIIDCLTSTVDRVLGDKLQEIEHSLSKSAQYGEGQMNFGRLAGINEERANIIMELHTLDNEIKELGVQAADVLTELSQNMSSNMAEVSGSERIDLAIKINGQMLVDAKSFESILKVVSLSTESTEFFKKCVNAVKAVIEKHNALVRADKELIAMQNEYIKYMRENNIENTVIANTLLKQSLRVFTGPVGSGRSIIPYLLSEYKSRQNANVLLVDLTGTCKWKNYGISSVTLDDYKTNRYQEQLLLVQGECKTPEEAQALSAILTRAADFYRVINIVLNMEQTQVFDILCSDIRCINFITDTKLERMIEVKNFIPRVTYNNVAKRLIVNDCSIPASEAIKFFNLVDKIDMQVLTIDHIKQLELASFRHLNPSRIDAVAAAIKDVSKYA